MQTVEDTNVLQIFQDSIILEEDQDLLKTNTKVENTNKKIHLLLSSLKC